MPQIKLQLGEAQNIPQYKFCQHFFLRCVAHAKVSVLMPKRECQ